MEEWIENIRLYLSKGYKGIIFSFLIVTYLMYNFIWSIVEPIGIQSSIDSPSFIGIHCKYIYIQIIFSLVFSLGVNGWLYRTLKIYLERISLHPGDTKLDECWINAEKNSTKSILNDGFLGRTVKITGEPDYAIDYNVKASSLKAKRIEYIIKPQNDFILYMRVKVKPSKNIEDASYKWIALRLESVGVAPSPLGNGNDEWNYPAKEYNMQGGWIRYTTNIEEAVKKTFGNNGWKYCGIVSIRIRGTVEISSITLF